MPNLPNIMVVDDDADDRFLIQHRLKKILGECAFVACASGDEALALLKVAFVDAIVTDHQLGQTSGTQFILEARRRGVGCPIIVVTGSDNPRIEREAYEAGATKVFPGGRGDFPEFLQQLLRPPECV